MPGRTKLISKESIIFSHAQAQPNAWTFTIKPIKLLIERYVGDGLGWVDPFAGENSPAEYTNDLNPKRPTRYHLEAVDFCEMLKGQYKGIIFDPPYSYRQISEHYAENGLKATALDTSINFFARVMNAICNKIALGGIAISCGWNTNGFGKSSMPSECKTSKSMTNSTSIRTCHRHHRN